VAEEAAQPITGLRRGDVSPYAFVCGDPARVDRIAARWKGVRQVCNLREYRVAVGEHEGVRLTAASTGIGGPSTAILIEELAKIGVRTFIRIGNSGGLGSDLALGDLVVTTGAVRDDGTSRAYVAPEYPAVASYEIVVALVEAARDRGIPVRTGITWSLDAFYARNAILASDGSLRSMSFEEYWPPGLAERISDMQRARVLNCEMESGVLLTLAGLFGLRAGAICVVSDRTPWPGPSEIEIDRNMDRCIDVALGAMLRLARG
jgi:uridine phosphorylase